MSSSRSYDLNYPVMLFFFLCFGLGSLVCLKRSLCLKRLSFDSLRSNYCRGDICLPKVLNWFLALIDCFFSYTILVGMIDLGFRSSGSGCLARVCVFVVDGEAICFLGRGARNTFFGFAWICLLGSKGLIFEWLQCQMSSRNPQIICSLPFIIS